MFALAPFIYVKKIIYGSGLLEDMILIDDIRAVDKYLDVICVLSQLIMLIGGLLDFCSN